MIASTKRSGLNAHFFFTSLFERLILQDMEDEKRREQIIKLVWKLVEPIIEAECMELIEVEYQREVRGWTLRLYLDHEKGISIADCTNISRQVSDLLDVEDIIPNAYTLEVSSPGLNRPIRRPKDFKKFIGQEVHIKTKEPYGNRRNFRGYLVEFSDNNITIRCKDETVYEISLENVYKANLIAH